MKCSNTIIPGYEDTSKIKNPGLEMKVDKLIEDTPKSEAEIIKDKMAKFESAPKAQYPKTMRGPDVWAVYTEYNGNLYSVVKGDERGSVWKLEKQIGPNEYQELYTFNKRKDALDEIPYL